MPFALDQIDSLSQAEQDAILNGPALQPPPNFSSNFDNPPNNDAIGYIATSICLAAAFFGIVVRIYGRFFCVRQVSIEDCTGSYVGYIYVTYWLLDAIGFYVHQWDIRIRDFTTLLYIIHIGSNCYSVTMMIMKASILKDWCRIFVPYGVRNAFFYTCHIVMAFNIAFYAAIIIVENLSSLPRKRIWDKTVPGTSHVDTKIIAIAAASINVVIDVITLILPHRIIWRLQMPMKQKIGVSLVFTIGILACVSAVSRLAYTARYCASDDTAYTLSSLSLWAISEMTCMFLIFGGTVVPKIFTSDNLISNFIIRMKSWYTLQRKSTTRNSGSSLPPRSLQDSRPRKAY
ncbi:hypothetical protein F4814DRAFT_458443 [Daldinia grandis]|nr:hypothetical protein F4814DRAFT_458443 [Daldinia grandis]